MNLVRLSFILGMTSLSAYSLYSAVRSPYVAPIASADSVQTTIVRCMSGGGYYNEGYFFMAVIAIGAALAVACADLARRVY